MDSTTTSRPVPGHHSVAAQAGPNATAAPHRAAATRRPVALSLALALARNLDVVLVVLVAPLAVALGAPLFGVSVGACGWLLQRALAVVDRRLINRAAAPGSRLGLNFVEAFARVWLLVGAIVAAGAIGRRADGLAAALLIFAAYSIALAVRVASGRPGADER